MKKNINLEKVIKQHFEAQTKKPNISFTQILTIVTTIISDLESQGITLASILTQLQTILGLVGIGTPTADVIKKVLSNLGK